MNELLKKLASEEGYDDTAEFLEACCGDSVVPAICASCNTLHQMEPDYADGFCDDCGKNEVKSALVLAGLI